MAVLLGYLAASNTGGVNAPAISDDLHTFEPYDLWPPGPQAASSALIQTITSNLPVTNDAARQLNGYRARGYVDDFYGRIHYSTLTFDLGNVISATDREVLIWNAYLGQARTLASLPATGDEGIIVTLPGTGSLPLVFPSLAEYTFTFTITTDGPPVIDAAYNFTWDNPSDNAIARFTGSRITAWLWRPDWKHGITETLEWLTDVIRASDGTEQRIRLRALPRRAFDFSYGVEGQQRRRMEAALWDWQARVWLLPIFTDAQQTTIAHTSGAQAITVPTTGYDYHPGGFGIFIDHATDRHEVFQIDTVTADGVTTRRPLTMDWPARTHIYPATPARLAARHRMDRFTGDYADARASFRLTDPATFTASEGTAASYRGIPVFEQRHNWSRDHAEESRRTVRTIDMQTGLWSDDDESGKPETLISHRWTAANRAEIAALRAWLYARAGRLTHFWRPTFLPDLVVTAPIPEHGGSIDIAAIGYTKHYKLAIGRRDIRLEHIDGTVYYARITAAQEVDAQTERLALDIIFDRQILQSEIARVSFMTLRRLDTDRIELAWWSGESAEAAFNLRSVANDL